MNITSYIRNNKILVYCVSLIVVAGMVLIPLYQVGINYQRQNKNKIGTIAGYEITPREYQEAYHEVALIEAIKRHNGQLIDSYSPEHQSAWELILIEYYIFLEEMKALGIVVTPSELRDLQEGRHISSFFERHLSLGHLSKENQASVIRNFRKNNPQVWKRFAHIHKNTAKKEKLAKLWGGLSMPNESQLLADWEKQNEACAIRYFRMPIEMDSKPLSDEVLQKFMLQHQKRYQRSPYRVTHNVEFDVAPSAQDRKVLIKRIELVKEGFAQTKDPIQFARHENEQGAPHSLIYKQDEMHPFIKALKPKIGDVIGPIEIDKNTYRVYRYLGRKQEKKSYLYEFAIITFKLMPSAKTHKKTRLEMIQLFKGVQSEKEFEAKAKETGLLPFKDKIEKTRAQKIGGTSLTSQIIQWVYKEDKINTISEPFIDNKTNKGYIVFLAEDHTGELPSLEEEHIRNQITFHIGAEEATEKLYHQMKKQQKEENQSFMQLCHTRHEYKPEVNQLTLYPYNDSKKYKLQPEVLGASKSLAEGQVVIVKSSANGYVYVIERLPDSQIEPDTLSQENFKEYKKRKEEAYFDLIIYSIQTELREKADVQDNRYKIF